MLNFKYINFIANKILFPYYIEYRLFLYIILLKFHENVFKKKKINLLVIHILL